eukprot:394092-Rhodomonas_salina.1
MSAARQITHEQCLFPRTRQTEKKKKLLQTLFLGGFRASNNSRWVRDAPILEGAHRGVQGTAWYQCATSFQQLTSQKSEDSYPTSHSE